MAANPTTDVEEISSDEEVLRLLESFVRSRLGSETTIEGFSRVSTGRSRQNWLFDAVWDHEGTSRREPLIVRRDPLGGLIETDRATEFAMLRALEATPIPTPQALWLDAKGEELGRPCLVMVRIDGTCDYYALNGRSSLIDRVDLARRLCALLVDVHAVDWRDIGLGEHFADPGPAASLVALNEWEAVLQRDQSEPYPELVLGGQWLRSHAPRSPRTVLVHADFKVGNVLLNDDGQIVALLDWELAHLGDPHEDLGWVTQPLRTKEHYINGSWEREELLGYYENVSGHTVDRHAVSWWNAFATYKTAVMQVSGLRAYLEGRSDEHYQPSAPVLNAVLFATMHESSEVGLQSQARELAQRMTTTFDSEAFLAWDTDATMGLLREFSSLSTNDLPNVDGDEAANRHVRGLLVELLGGLPPNELGDLARRTISLHLLDRVARNPALARRKK